MVNQNEFMKSPMGQAITELNQEMAQRNLPPISLNVVGGFALMLHGVRDIDTQTDIDYVGKKLPEIITEISNPIGIRHGLGRSWINNDVMLADIDVKDFEYVTGELHFEPALDLDRIQINILDPKDLLRMKLIAVDTASTAVECGGDFTRMKDIPDILALMNIQHETYESLEFKNKKYLINDDTLKLVQLYETQGASAVDNYLNNRGSRTAKRTGAKSVPDDFDQIFSESKSKSEPKWLKNLEDLLADYPQI